MLNKFSAWDKLLTFYFVAKFKSFTRAGEHLNLSQSALSRAIATLEQRIGHKLFVRHTRGLQLTQYGETLLDAAESMLNIFETAYAIMEGQGEQPRGILKVAATASFAFLYLPDYIPQFLSLYPHIRLSILGTDIAPNFSIHEADVIIHPRIKEQPDLEQKYLMTFHLGLFASPEYLAQFGVPQVPADLNAHRLISYGDLGFHPFDNANWHLSLEMPAGQIRPPYLQINSALSLCRLAEQGVGIISVACEQPEINKMKLVPVLSNIPGPTIKAYYIYPRHLKDSKRVQAFYDFLKEELERRYES
jgi:DNA-binding transcriptional LysR family regulator